MESRIDPVPPQLQFPPDSLKSSEFALGDHSFIGLQFASDRPAASQNHASSLNQWPYHGLPSSPTTSQYPPPIHTRLSKSQDAWNPLHLAVQTANFSSQPHNKFQQSGGVDSGHPNSQYSSFSDNDGKYNYFHSPGSAYGGKRGTASSVTTSFADSAYGSQLSNEHELDQAESPSALEQRAVQYSDDQADTREMPDPSTIPVPDLKCEYPGCRWTGKCPSDLRCASNDLPLLSMPC